MELELKHLAAYLPYQLKVGFEADEYTHAVVGLDITSKVMQIISPFKDYGTCSIDMCKPILRPLSHLICEIEHNGEKFIPMDWFDENIEPIYCDVEELVEHFISNTLSLPYDVILKLLEWHFDIFSLIEAGLAIDINALEQH